MSGRESTRGQLFGRDSDLERIAHARPALLVLHGDSGVGKSALLAAAHARADDALAPEAIELYSSDGAVQQAVLDALGSALAVLLLEEPWLGARATIIDFVRRLLESAPSEARRVAGLALVGRLRDRYGDETVDAIGDILADARVAIDEALDKRLTAARVPSAAEELLILADELRELSGRRDIVLSLDRLEGLPESDVRILADIARIAPTGVCIRGAVMDASPQGRAVIDLLKSCGGSAVAFEEVRPLGFEGVRAWAEEAGLDGALAAELLTATGGYPLHLGDAVLHLQQGGGLHDLTANRDFGAAIDRAWQEMDHDVRQVARQLVVLDRPPPLGAILEVLQLPEPAWWDSAAQLQEARIFTQLVDDLPWFHEQRRKWLLDRLPEVERRSYASRLVPAILDLLPEPAGWQYTTALAGVLEMAGSDVEHDRLRMAVSLIPAQLAIMGALLELGEPGNQWASEAQAALNHARHHFGAEGDLVASLQALEQAGFVAVASNEESALAVPVLDLPVTAAIAGLCQRRLGRMPIPALASAIWTSVLGPLAAPFEFAVYGIGSPVPGKLAHDLHVTQMGQTGAVHHGFHGCVAYGTHRLTQIYAVASVARDRTAALAERWRGARMELAGGTFAVDSLVEYPSSRFRTNRWLVVADDLVETDGYGREDAGLDLATELMLESGIRERARSLMSPLERLAVGARHPVHLFYAKHDRTMTVARVVGLAAGVTSVDRLTRQGLSDPYRFLRLALDLDLPSQAVVSRVRTGTRIDRSHPLRQFGKEMAKRLAEFNKEQPRIEIDLAPGALEPWLEELLEHRYDDVVAMLSVVGEVPLQPSKREVFIVTSPVPRDSPIDMPPACVATRPADRSRVNYAIRDEPICGWGLEEMVAVFPDAEELQWRGYACVDDAIAELSGFADEDVSAFASLRDLGLLKSRGVSGGDRPSEFPQ